MKRLIAVSLLSLFCASDLNSQEHITRWRIVVQFEVPKGYLQPSFRWMDVCRAAEMEIVQQGFEPRGCGLEGKTAKGWPK